jgi:hypothetical protein
MSFTGGSISQGALLSSQDGRISSVEALAGSKVAQSVYDAKVALLDAKDVEHDGRLTAVEALAESKVAQSAYDAKVALLDAKDVEHDGRLDAVEALAESKVAQSAYDAKVALLDAKDVEHDGRLDAVESRATALETDISGRVQIAIDEKVAQTVFDALATELRSADSALTSAVATKVATITQEAVDNAQNAVIETKANIADLNASVTTLNASIATKVAQSDYNTKTSDLTSRDYSFERRLLAFEEFARVLLATYNITKPDGQLYSFTASTQGLPAGEPLLSAVAKDASGRIVLRLSRSAYAMMYGKVRASIPSGNVDISKSGFNSSTRQATIVPVGAVTFPFNITLLDSEGSSIVGLQMNQGLYDSLPVV